MCLTDGQKMRRSFRERVINYCFYVLPTLCFLVTFFLYREQGRYYSQKILSIESLFLKTVDLSEVDIEKLEKNLTFINKGGWYKPKNCTCHGDKKVAIIIPFRKRHQHLAILLRHLHPFLRKQAVYYRIFIIEQADEKLFNRAKLLNIGFVEAGRIDDFNCYIFHDVDLLPLSEGNEYYCPSSPRHMSVAVDTMDFRYASQREQPGVNSEPYEGIFGGVTAIYAEHFKSVNGYPNRYWGWGGEDDDLFERLNAVGHKITSPSSIDGLYKMMPHGHSVAEEFDDRYNTLRQWQKHKNSDGLNTLTYEVVRRENLKLYTLISCKI